LNEVKINPFNFSILTHLPFRDSRRCVDAADHDMNCDGLVMIISDTS